MGCRDVISLRGAFISLLCLLGFSSFLLQRYLLLAGYSLSSSHTRDNVSHVFQYQQAPVNATSDPGVLSNVTSLSTISTPSIPSPSDYIGRRIGIGCGLTMAKLYNIQDPDSLKAKSPFFKHLLPTFCETASKNFSYTMFIAYDYDDKFLSKSDNMKTFVKVFENIRTSQCSGGFQFDFRFVRCNHSGQPARAQNDALMAAFFAGMDYLYMVNDDSIMQTEDWTPKLIQQLAKYTPPNVGLTGPTHSGGNTAILTYNFVHRTHVDIFKWFYPPEITDWFGDRWISTVYLPNNARKEPSVKLKHTLEMGRRYRLNPKVHGKLKMLIENGRQVLRAYLESRDVNWEEWTKKKTKPK